MLYNSNTELSRRDVFALEFLKHKLDNAQPSDTYESAIELSVNCANLMIDLLDNPVVEEEIGYESNTETVDDVVEKSFEEIMNSIK